MSWNHKGRLHRTAICMQETIIVQLPWVHIIVIESARLLLPMPSFEKASHAVVCTGSMLHERVSDRNERVMIQDSKSSWSARKYTCEESLMHVLVKDTLYDSSFPREESFRMSLSTIMRHFHSSMGRFFAELGFIFPCWCQACRLERECWETFC